MEQNYHYILVIKPKDYSNSVDPWVLWRIALLTCFERSKNSSHEGVGDIARCLFWRLRTGTWATPRLCSCIHYRLRTALLSDGVLNYLNLCCSGVCLPSSQMRSSWGLWLKTFHSAGCLWAQWFAVKVCWSALNTVASKVGVPYQGVTEVPLRGSARKYQKLWL